MARATRPSSTGSGRAAVGRAEAGGRHPPERDRRFPDRPGPAGAHHQPDPARDLSGRPLRARLQHPAGAAGRHDLVRADHRQTGQPDHPDPVRALSDRGSVRGCRPGRAGGAAETGRLLPGQDRHPAQARRRPGRGLRGRGPQRLASWSRCPASAARPPTWCSATRSAFPASRSTPTSAGWRDGSGGRRRWSPSRSNRVGRAVPPQGLDPALPQRHLARPAPLPRPQPGVRRLPGRSLVSGVRRGRDRSDEGGQARPRAAGMTIGAAPVGHRRRQRSDCCLTPPPGTCHRLRPLDRALLDDERLQRAVALRPVSVAGRRPCWS